MSRSHEIRLCARGAAVAALLAAAIASPLVAQPGALFPQPFRVEHHLVQDDGDGSRFIGEAVVDTYGGSWIVSERPDGSRLIVDLVRRELTEVRAAKGTYWTLSFDRLAELQGRLRRAQGLASGDGASDGDASGAAAATRIAAPTQAGPDSASPVGGELVVTDVPADETSRALGAARAAAGAAIARPGVKHLRVTRRGAPDDAVMEVWVDPAVRLSAAAQGAIGALETQVLADLSTAVASPRGTGGAAVRRTSGAGRGTSAAAAVVLSPARSLAAARAHSGGALPIRTVRPLHSEAGAATGGSVEDVATRVQPLERFPSDLAEIPEGLRRVPHPLEATVRFLEEEAVRNAAMSGAAAEAP